MFMRLIVNNPMPPRSAIGALVFGLLLSLQIRPTSAQDLKALNHKVWVSEMVLARSVRDPAAHARLAEAYLSRARLLGDWADIERAEKTLAQARQLNPQHPEVLLVEADLHRYQHHFRESLHAANQLVQISPTDPRGYGVAGDAALEIGDLVSAQKMYEEMVALGRDFASLSRLSHLHEARGDNEKAAALMQEAIALIGAGVDSTATRRWAKVLVASLEMKQGRLERAEEILKAVLAEQPDDDFALEHLGETYGLLGRYSESDSIYARAFSLRLEPAYAIAWAEIKRSLGQQAFADTLDQIAERALSIHVRIGRVAYLRELATFYLQRGKNLQEALRLAIQDTTIRQDTRAFEILAWALHRNGQHKAAGKVIERALARPDAEAMTYYRAGIIAMKLGKKARAKSFLQRSLHMNPDFSRPEADEARALLKKL